MVTKLFKRGEADGVTEFAPAHTAAEPGGGVQPFQLRQVGQEPPATTSDSTSGDADAADKGRRRADTTRPRRNPKSTWRLFSARLSSKDSATARSRVRIRRRRTFKRRSPRSAKQPGNSRHSSLSFAWRPKPS